MADIKIYGVLVNDTSEGIVTRSDQVFDKNLGKTQEAINSELYEIADSVKDLTITYDDFVTEKSSNAVKSSGVFKAIKNVADHLPFIGEDGYVYVWDPAIGDYKKSGTNLTGPAGETGGGIHLLLDTAVITVDEFGVSNPSGPIRVRAIRQYGETGLDEFKDGRIRWWFNDIEDENVPDGESPVDEDGKGVSEVFIDVDIDHVEKITIRLYLDQAATKLYDQQDIVILRHPTIYKLDLTNENSMVPMEDDEGNVKDAFLESTQAILYHGATQVPFEEIEYSIEPNDHEGIEVATIDEKGIVTLSGWKTAWSNVSIKITAKYKGHLFYATYNIARVSGVAIYRLKPAITNIKKNKDGSFNNIDKLYINVMKVVGSNTGSMTEKVLDLAAEKISVKYTYNNKVNSKEDIYTINDIVNEGIPIKDDELPETLDGSLVSEIDVYLVKQKTKQEAENDSEENNWGLDVYIDHETVPLVEDGDDGFTLMLSNENMTIGALPDGTQVGQLFNTQGLLYKGIVNYSDKAKWTYEILSGSIKGTPQWDRNVPGFLILSGCEVGKNSDRVEIALYAQYPKEVGEKFHKVCTISKAKQGKTGEAGYKSIIFCRTNKVPDTPRNGTTGGTYESPIPTEDVTSNGVSLGIKWHDGIPSGKEKLWSSSRYFSTYSIEDQKVTTWSIPTVISDTENMNIEFTWFDPCIGNPDTDDWAWFDPDKEPEEFQSHSMIYMATQKIENGEPVTHIDADGNETSWTIVRILGEKGETALRSFVFARSATKPATPVGGTIEKPIPDPEQGDGTIWYDGIPGGDALLPVWGSLRTFSSLLHLQTDWSEPQIMKDVPNLYDIQYSIKKDRPEPPSNDYPSYGADWFDPEDPTATPEVLEQVMWMAQRWYSSDGWSPWDIIKVKGEDGKDGSKAIIRMRGAWDSVNGKPADIDYGEWILSGTTHKDNITGQIVTEEYQDLVYRTTGEVQNCYKCLISHMKSDAYDPGTVEYVWDSKTQTDKSIDGYWMKAEKYTFLATDLLNAKDIVADVITAHQTEILGKISGDWNKSQKEGNKTVFTRVKTQDGKIEFFYRHSESEDWKLSVDIGYDFESESGVLRFYDSDGVTPLYNLGPKGLTASSVQSPYCTEEEYLVWEALNFNEKFGNDYYRCYGVIFSDSEGSNIYNQYTEELKFIAKTTGIAMKESVFNTYSGVLKDTIDPKFRYKKLKTGSYIPQMTLNFWVTNPLTMEPIPYEGKSVGYPQNDPVINFGGNTIGYLALAEPDLKYQNVTFSFKVAGVDSSFGVLTNPVHHWICISEIMTDLEDIEGNFSDLEDGKSIDMYVGTGNPCFEIVGEDSGSMIVGHIRPKSELPGSKIFDTIASKNYVNKWYSDYLVFDTSAGSSPLMTLDSCKGVLEAALDLVGDTFYIFCGNIGSGDGNIQKSPGANQSVTIMCGLQMAFYKACSVIGKMPRNVFIMAKQILSCMTTDIFGNEWGSDGGVDEVIGYIFPEDKCYEYNSDTGEISLTSLLPSGSLSINSPFDGTDYYKLTIPGAEFGYFPEDSTNQRAYLMISSTSSNIGTTEVTNTGDLTGNTYKISFKSQLDSDNNTKIVLVIEPVNYISAFLGEGKHFMPRYYSSTPTFLSNLNFTYGIKKGHK